MAAATSKQLDKARAAVKKKNYEYAAELYNLHLKANPTDVDARRELRTAERQHKKLNGGTGFMAKARAKKLEIQAASIRVSKKDPEKTMIACEELLKGDPDNATALIRLGEAASHANHVEVAVFAFEDALSINSSNKEALRLLGRVHEASDNLELALKCFQKLARVDPKDTEAADKVKKIPASITSKGFEGGTKEGGFQNLIDKDEAKKLERQSTRIRTPEQALERISDLEPALLEDPNDTKTMRLIAELYLKAELPKKALEMVDRAVKTDPADYLSSELRGDLLLKQYEANVKKLTAAYRQNPNDPNTKAKLVKARKAKLVFEMEEFRKRAEAHPTETGLRFPLGKALFDAGKIDEAIPELQKAKSDPRKKTDASYYLGQCYIKKKILKMALKELATAREELFEMDETKKEITYLIGRIYEGASKQEKALREYESIAEVDFQYKDVNDRIRKLGEI